jgi:hypothetical protein
MSARSHCFQNLRLRAPIKRLSYLGRRRASSGRRTREPYELGVSAPYERAGLTAANHRQRGYVESPGPTGLLPQYCFCPRLVYDAVRDAVD